MRLLNWTIGIAVTVTTTLLASSARAENEPIPTAPHVRHFGDHGFIISADRLLPLLSYQSVTTTPAGGPSETSSRTSVALMNNGPYGVFNSFYNLPRLGFDWLPIDNLTLGGAAWFYTDLQASDSATVSGVSKTTDQPKATYWGIAPRVGYVFRMGDMLSIWPRAGVEYHHVSLSDVGAGSQSVIQFAFEAEALLVISPWNHFGFMVGPTLDAPISGEQTSAVTSGMGGTTTTSRVNSAMWQVGLSAGMLGDV
jgi:opacity protein-like surface antigen